MAEPTNFVLSIQGGDGGLQVPGSDSVSQIIAGIVQDVWPGICEETTCKGNPLDIIHL